MQRGSHHKRKARAAIARAMRKATCFVQPEFRARLGFLSADERRLVIGEIRAGRRYRLIGRDWLMHPCAIGKLAQRAGFARGGRHHRRRLLTHSERAIALRFFERPSVTKAELRAALYPRGRNRLPQTACLHQLVSNLRRKLKPRRIRILPVRGVGWRMTEPSRAKLRALLWQEA